MYGRNVDGEERFFLGTARVRSDMVSAVAAVEPPPPPSESVSVFSPSADAVAGAVAAVVVVGDCWCACGSHVAAAMESFPAAVGAAADAVAVWSR